MTLAIATTRHGVVATVSAITQPASRTTMCSREDDPTQHDLRRYDVEYVAATPCRPTFRRERVWAATTDDARRQVQALDPEYLATTKTPRIVR